MRINNVPVNPMPYLLAGTAARWTRGIKLNAGRCADPNAYRSARIDDCR